MNTSVASYEAPAPQRSRSLAFVGTFVLLSIVAGFAAVIPHMAHVAMAAVYLGAFLAYLGLRSDSQGATLFEVIVPLSILSFFYFGVAPVYLEFNPEALVYSALEPFLLSAQAVSTLGFLCFLVGYGWSFRYTPPSPWKRYAPASPLVYIIPGAIGTIGMSVHNLQTEGIFSGQRISAGLSFLQQFGYLFFFGWFLAWYMMWAGRVRRSVAVPVLVAMTACASLVLAFTFGSKMLAVTIIGLPAMAYYEVKRKIPLKTAIVVVMIFVFLIFPMYNTYRQMDRDLGASRRLDQTFAQASNWNSEKYLDASLFAFLQRMTVVTSVAAIVSETGRFVPYRYGETLLLAPIGLLIPRFLWPEKPEIGIGREFGATFRLTNPLDNETEIAPSVVGEFYWNFAIPGVIVGMWLLGMAYRWYFQRYGAGTGFDPLRKAVYATLLPSALLIEGSFAVTIGGLIKTLVILSLFLLLTRRLGWLEEQPES